MYTLTIVESGSGDEFLLGTFDTLMACSGELERLDERFRTWDWDSGERPPAGDPLLHYEGCDPYATDEDGVTYSEDGNGAWENDETGELVWEPY